MKTSFHMRKWREKERQIESKGDRCKNTIVKCDLSDLVDGVLETAVQSLTFAQNSAKNIQ